MAEGDRIEQMLRESLVPRGFTDRGAREMNALIDGLAGLEAEAPGRPWGKISGIAATIMGAVAVGWLALPRPPAPRVVAAPRIEPAVQLVSSSEDVVSAERDGELLTDEDGSLFQGWHVKVVNEERFHDEESGETVRVLHPREEWVMMPVSTF
ncbi:hypothetical protein [Haloferula sargassicola]|uniref:Uncharacterized protein n=1 Tax=Haloferula sargassicola TaxID=490096 RepID=A0ABP9UMQ6_9BACT